MCHTTYMQGNQEDSRFLVGKNQTANLTLGPSLGHNLCVQMGHANLYWTFKFQEISNDIRNVSIKWVLAPAIAL
jgi:hypothetical protein